MNGFERGFKHEADESIERLLDAATWWDIEEALRDSDADRVVGNDAVRRQFGLTE